MKKTALIVTSSVFLFLSLIYVALFTSVGNNLLKPVIEAKVNENLPLKIRLSEFLLDTKSLRLLIELDSDNTLLAQGNYSLFDQSFDIDYTLELNSLSNIKELAEQNLSGKLFTEGNIKGDMELFKIKGEGDLARSRTDYAAVIKEMALQKAAIKLKDAHIQEILSMTGEKPYAEGKIDLHVQLNDLNPKDMEGSVALDVKEARLNAELLKKEFGLTLSKTSLKSDLKAKLKGESVKYLFTLDSELAKFYSKGQVEVGARSIDSNYRVQIQELALLRSVTNAPLRGPFSTQGDISGDEKELLIKGRSNIADSKSSYDVKLKELSPSKVIIHIKDARLDRLLYMLGEAQFASAKINADIEFNDLNPKTLKGEANIRLSEGKVNQKLMSKEFKIKLPKTSFKLQASTALKPEKINYTLSLSSNLAKIKSKGEVNPQDIRTRASYGIDIKELALLKPITSLPLRGPLATSGKLSGDKKELVIKGSSNLAGSKTDYELILEELSAKSAKVLMKNAELSKLLYLLGEPSYAEGRLNAEIDLDSIASLNGILKVGVSKGLVHKKIVKKNFDINLPYTKFDLKSDATIKDDKLRAKTVLSSNLATLKMNKSSFDIKRVSFLSDYDIFIPFLQRLEPILERKLYGELRANGEIRKDKQLTLTAHSKIFQGEFNAKIVDDKIDADFKELHAIGLLKMLGYPEVMDAPVNGTLVYNTKSKKGKLVTRFERAVLTRSKMTDLIQGLTRTDLTKERFNKGSLVSVINKEIINSDLKMQSKRASLKSKKFIINSKKQLIDARFALKIKEYPGDVIVKGSINSPKVKLDAKSMITPQIEKKVGKEIDRFLKKLF